MRKFKFRLWNEETKSMMYKDIMEVGCCEFDVLMQYTGLKDKNDIGIYEGDILSIDNSSPNRSDIKIDEVEWYEMHCTFGFQGYSLGRQDGYYEVIGNIYENPELLP